jgi:hypothetical protein
LASLARTEFLMQNSDLAQSWFFKHANREISIQLLSGKPYGTFLVRPSSKRGCYALSCVGNSGNTPPTAAAAAAAAAITPNSTGNSTTIQHHIVYGLFPGYSLLQVPVSSNDIFPSLSALVQHCDFLRQGLVNDNAASRLCQESQVTKGYARKHMMHN